MNLGPIIAAVLGSGAAGAVITGLFSRRKAAADAANVISSSAAGVVDMLYRRLSEMTAELADARAEIRHLSDRLSDALASLEQARFAMQHLERQLDRRPERSGLPPE